MANDTEYGLACAVFTENGSRAIRVTNALEAGMAWVSAKLSLLLDEQKYNVCSVR